MRPRRWSLICALLLSTGVGALSGAPTASAAETEFTFQGHGWGHGRGMGQWGAVGYAVDHAWTWQQITDHYYGGTFVAQDAGNPVISVRLEALVGKDLVAIGSPGSLSVIGAGQGSIGGQTSVVVRRTGANSFAVYGGPACSGPWTAIATVSGPVVVRASGGPAYTDLVRTCESGQARSYRGEFVALDDGVRQVAVNRLPVDDYLLAVVPRELSGYIGDLGGGRGMHALRAQAVTARSYALSENRWPYATTCDTTSCQVYGGAAVIAPAGSVQVLDDPRTTQAVLETTGHVRRTAAGAVARTEFSASSGGWTAGGAFPAVVDEGDSYSGNPHHSWTAAMTAPQVAAALGVGAVSAIYVTQRNGLGDFQGRALSLAVDTDQGRRAYSGDEFRSRLSLKSTWFDVRWIAVDEARKFVQALYRDFLGREGDAGGLDYWSHAISSGRVAHSQVAATLASSEEWVGHVVDNFYADTLGRAPDPDGRAFWVDRLRKGSAVAEVAANFYASEEYFAGLGGGATVTWVGDLYRKLLGRDPDAVGQAWWVDRVTQVGRVAVARSFYDSAESCRVRIDGLYQHLLGRPAEQGGIASWTPIVAARGDVVLAASLAASPEYWARAQGS